jgi:hypothetical protein
MEPPLRPACQRGQFNCLATLTARASFALVCPTWRDATIPKLAQAAYDERELPSGHLDTKRLAILADALEEAGCTNEDVLEHLPFLFVVLGLVRLGRDSVEPNPATPVDAR